MADAGEGRGGRGGASIDAVLREVLRQGRLDPGAERLAAQGVERLRSFLSGDPSADGGAAPGGPGAPGAPAGGVPLEAEVVEDAAVAAPGAAAERLRHTVPLRGGRQAELLLPADLTGADARRIAAVLDALALDDEEGPAA